MPAVKVTFSSPTHGWLPTRVEVGAVVVEFAASDVPNNPVEELYNAVAASAAGREGTVWWHLEPDGYFFEISNTGGGVHLRVLFAERSSESAKVEIVSISGSKAEVLLPLWRALRQFESLHAQEPHWPPTQLASMEELREVLREKTEG